MQRRLVEAVGSSASSTHGRGEAEVWRAHMHTHRTHTARTHAAHTHTCCTHTRSAMAMAAVRAEAEEQRGAAKQSSGTAAAAASARMQQKQQNASSRARRRIATSGGSKHQLNSAARPELGFVGGYARGLGRRGKEVGENGELTVRLKRGSVRSTGVEAVRIDAGGRRGAAAEPSSMPTGEGAPAHSTIRRRGGRRLRTSGSGRGCAGCLVDTESSAPRRRPRSAELAREREQGGGKAATKGVEGSKGSRGRPYPPPTCPGRRGGARAARCAPSMEGMTREGGVVEGGKVGWAVAVLVGPKVPSVNWSITFTPFLLR